MLDKFRKAPDRLGSDLVVIKLFEIADRLADQVPKGVLASKQFTVGTSWVQLDLGGWMAIDIFNDGDADLYIRTEDMSTNPWDLGEAPLKKGDHLPIRLGAKLYPSDIPGEAKRYGPPIICLICQSSTATVRVFQLG